jgi:hypothetical protein
VASGTDKSETILSVKQPAGGGTRDILNLDAIRKRVMVGLGAACKTAAAFGGGPAISRRSLFRGSAAGFFSARLMPGLNRDAPARVKVVKDGNRVVFLLDRHELFVIDGDLFAPQDAFVGPAVLRLTRSQNVTRVTLANARFVGTSLVADLAVRLQPTKHGDILILSFTKLGWKFKIDDMVAWADGRIVPSCMNIHALRIAHFGSRGEIALLCRARIEFRADWSIRSQRGAAVRVDGLMDPASTESIRLQPVAASKAELIAAEGRPVTIVELSRGQNNWAFGLVRSLPSAARLTGPNEPADTIRVELSVDGLGMPIAALLAETRLSDPEWRIRFMVNGRESGIPLRGLRHVAAYRDGAVSASVLATMPSGLSRVEWGVYALQVGAPADRPAFELVVDRGQRVTTRLTVTLSGVDIPVDSHDLGALIAHTAVVPESSSIDIYFDGIPEHRPTDNACTVGDGATLHLCSWTLSVLRPRDMLSLDFKFQGFRLSEKEGAPHVFAQIDNGITPRIIVTLPPQHVSEHLVDGAYVSDDGSLGGKIAPLDPSKVSLPFDSDITPPSRLAFVPPPWHATEGLRLRMSDLLDWREWQMAVSGFAIPKVGERPPLLPAHWDHSVAQWDQTVAALAGHSPKESGNAPAAAETSINVPRFFVLSPNAWSVWHSTASPPRGVAENAPIVAPIWHTRLGVFNAGGIDSDTGRLVSTWDPTFMPPLETLRAVGLTDTTGPGACSIDFLPTLTDAAQILDLSSNFKLTFKPVLGSPGMALPNTNYYEPLPIPFQQLMLSSMGALLKLRGTWNPSNIADPGYSIEEWVQETIWSRDQAQLIAYKGYALPTGHEVALIRKADREFHLLTDADGTVGWGAIEVVRYYCEVREPTIAYPYPPEEAAKFEGRCWPFKSITLTPTRSPYLQDPIDVGTGKCVSSAGALTTLSAFWMFPLAAGQACTAPDSLKDDGSRPFEFTLKCVDWQNREIDFTLPLLWVNRNLAEINVLHKPADSTMPCSLPIDAGFVSFDDIVKAYRTAPAGTPNSRRRGDAKGQTIAYAPLMPPPVAGSPPKAPPPSTAFPTKGFWSDILTVDESNKFLPTDPNTHLPQMQWPTDFANLKFIPILDRAVITVPASQVMTGSGGSGTSWVRYDDIYRIWGFGSYTATASDNKTRTLKNSVYLDFYYPYPGEQAGDSDYTQPSAFALPGTKAGGLAFPSMNFAFMSRISGPMGGDPHEWPNNLNPRTPSGPPHGNDDIMAGWARWDSMLQSFSSILGPDLKIAEILTGVDLGADQIAQLPALVENQINQAMMVVQQVEAFRQQVESAITLVQRFRELPQQIVRNAKQTLIQAVEDRVTTWAKKVLAAAQSQLNNWLAANIKPLTDAMGDVIDTAQGWTDEVYEITNALYQDDLRLVALYLSAEGIAVRYLQKIHSLVQIATSPNVDQAQKVQIIAAGVVDLLGGVVATPFNNAVDMFAQVEQFASTLATASQGVGQVLGQLGTSVKTAKDQFKSLKDLTSPGATAFATSIKNTMVAEVPGILAPVVAPVRPEAVSDQMVQDWQNAWADAAQDYSKANSQYITMRNSLNDALVKAHDARKAGIDYLNASINTAIGDVSAGLEDAIDDFIGSAVDDASGPVAQIMTAIGTIADLLNTIDGLIDEVESDIPNEISASYSLTPTLKNGPDGTPFFLASQSGRRAELTINAKISKKLIGDGSNLAAPPEVTISAQMTNFTIQLVPSLVFLKIGFDEIKFESINGGAPKTSMQIGDVELGGDLGFVKQLEALLNGTSGPFLEIGPTNVTAGYRFPIPIQPIGSFIIAQLAFDIGASLYFDSSTAAMAYLSISSRAKPCILTSGIYGGTFFFALGATTKGIQHVEVSFSFGVVAAMDIAGVSGIVTATGGIYFEKSTDFVLLTGFFRATGCFNIFGLIDLNLDFYLGFTYRQNPDGTHCAYGECEITVEIGFTFFTISYSLYEMKQIDGGEGGGGSQQLHALPAIVLRQELPLASLPAPANDPVRPWQVIMPEWRVREANYIPDDDNVFA